MNTWDNYMRGVCLAVAEKSKDSTKVGAILVSDTNNILLTGFNGPPANLPETPAMVQRPEKYQWVVHAEQNLICLAAKLGIQTENKTIYVTHAPCGECAKSIAQAGIKRVVNFGGHFGWPAQHELIFAQRLLQSLGIEYKSIYEH